VNRKRGRRAALNSNNSPTQIQILSEKLSKQAISNFSDDSHHVDVSSKESVVQVPSSFSSSKPDMGRSPAMKKADTRRKDVATACTYRKSKSTCIYVTQPQPLVDLRDAKSYISVVMDIETTGFSHSTDNIIQLAARANWVKPNGLWGSEIFNEYVSLPPGHTKARRKGVPHHIAKLTGITSRTLRTKGIPFECMWRKFTNWLSECSCKSISNSGKGTPVVLIAHNGKAFDFPFLHAALVKSQLHQNWERKANIVCFIDTLLILRSDEAWNSCKSKDISGIRSEKNNKENRSTLCNKEVRQNSDIVPPEKATVESLESDSCKPPKQSLGALHEHLFGTPIAGAHNALADVAALCSVLTSPAVRGRWQYVGNEMQLTRLSSSDNIIKLRIHETL
jgi:DNA polymerase III epsilon subunit-like protein